MKEQISTMIQAAIDGNASCCEVHTKLKELETVIKSGLKVIQGGVVDEARDFNKGERWFGGTWQIRAGSTILNYDEDQEYTDLNKMASHRKKLLNSAWKAKNEGIGFFTEEGEEVPVLSVKSSGKEVAVFKPTVQPEKKENDGKTDLAF